MLYVTIGYMCHLLCHLYVPFLASTANISGSVAAGMLTESSRSSSVPTTAFKVINFQEVFLAVSCVCSITDLVYGRM